MNVEHRIMYSTVYNKDKATRPPRLSEPTKGRRALSTARDGGQERLPHSTFDVERSIFKLLHLKLRLNLHITLKLRIQLRSSELSDNAQLGVGC